MRTFQNGGQDPYTVRVCSLDGLTVTYQLKECSRKKKMVKEEELYPQNQWLIKPLVPPPEIVEPEPIPKPVKKKYNGWPKGKPRGKRK